MKDFELAVFNDPTDAIIWFWSFQKYGKPRARAKNLFTEPVISFVLAFSEIK